MRWVTYRSPAAGGPRPGAIVDGSVHGLAGSQGLLDLLGDDGSRLAAAFDQAVADPLEVVALDAAELLAPIPVPPSIRDFLAFEEHVRNARGGEVDPGWYEQPVFYFSNPAAVHGPHQPVAVPPLTRQWDYELEVAAVIGRQGRDLDPDTAERHIAGYTVMCDWSARDLQAREMTQRLGPAKGKDSATSLGPALVTPDELAGLRSDRSYRLGMRASVNGVEYTSGNFADIHWSFPELIAHASRGTRVVPGDVIGSGTVGTGCILELSRLHGSDRYPWLLPGDRVRLEVDELGAIEAPIVDYPPPPA